MDSQDTNEKDIDSSADEAVASKPRISVCEAEGQQLSGLGMMILQYMEQNLAEFEYKVEEGLRIRCRVVVEVDKGIAITTTFMGEKIIIENGVADKPDLYMKSNYLLLAKILSGQASPFMEFLKGNIKLKAWPRKPFQALRVLRFLKIPAELLL